MNPASTTSVWPVILWDAADRKNATAAATSSGSSTVHSGERSALADAIACQ